MNSATIRRLLYLLAISFVVRRTVAADDDNAAAAGDDANAAAAGDDANAAAAGDDDYYNDDGAAVADASYYEDDRVADGNYYYTEGKDYIQYWTDYAILPKRCVVYNDVDVVVFSIFENQYNQCTDKAVGTYYIPVATYVKGYMTQKEQDMEDQGYDYEEPDVAQYIYCTPYEVQGVYKYFQLGCADDTTFAMAVNIYEDKDCTTRSAIDGYDDAAIDVSDIEPKFEKCKACVNWFDRNDDQAAVDDGFYENRKMNAPLCSNSWTYKEDCGRKCQHVGSSSKLGEGWSASDEVLLAILSAFGLFMLALIVSKRQTMSNKDTLLEKAALNAAGLQQPHVIGIFALVVVVIVVFILLGLKNITWALLLLINTALFGYLMKLTVTTSVGHEPIIGPDGEIIRQSDSDDSSVDTETDGQTPANAGTYSLPTLS